jgi:hypothetical protein
MKITEKQLLFLIEILGDSIRQNVIGIYKYSYDERAKTFDEIINQQSDEIKDIKD